MWELAHEIKECEKVYTVLFVTQKARKASAVSQAELEGLESKTDDGTTPGLRLRG